jgi:hypothetical protein
MPIAVSPTAAIVTDPPDASFPLPLTPLGAGCRIRSPAGGERTVPSKQPVIATTRNPTTIAAFQALQLHVLPRTLPG